MFELVASDGSSVVLEGITFHVSFKGWKVSFHFLSFFQLVKMDYPADRGGDWLWWSSITVVIDCSGKWPFPSLFSCSFLFTGFCPFSFPAFLIFLVSILICFPFQVHGSRHELQHHDHWVCLICCGLHSRAYWTCYWKSLVCICGSSPSSKIW